MTQDLLLLPGMAALADRYDGFILDLWGVLHDGSQPYPGVLDCLDRLRAAGKRVCLLSNAPRRTAGVVEKLSAMGIGAGHYDHLMTSGEAAHDALRDRDDAFHRDLGRRFLHVGPPRDADVYEGLDLVRVDAPEDAEFVLNTGIDDFDEALDDYAPLLARCAGLGLPMVCANPDLVVYSGDTLVICAGELARHYETLGGRVAYHGKPHAPVYARCLRLLGLPDRGRILAVGDSLRTDIAGANAAGIDGALVTGGIHREELGTAWGEHPEIGRLRAMVAASGHRPHAAVPRFAW
ncbi:TIGR01459 family HAD-type hydrolase [Arenibaculum pallidiluteum]|uniref:TIGR01459 family HAD-type hydrolase n=1 Tax=Arenibaculum pallidiluteum TaxID=2812559 RepID=UPI001A97025E|nr:TIGR01459 family HAD-type hydrolase [Arenibaculum pallidiluteum]